MVEAERWKTVVADLERRLADARQEADRYRMLADTAARTVDGLRVLLQMGEVAADLDRPTLEVVTDAGD